MKRRVWLLGWVAWCLWGSSVRAEDVRERLNKIFYWNLSDDLKLSPQQEKSMIAIVEDIQARRQKALRAHEDALGKMRDFKARSEASEGAWKKALESYRLSVDALARLDIEEHDRLLKVLGTSTLGKYYVDREDILRRVRQALQKKD